ncbi:protein of unknown function DUF4033 containing protein [Nitzschia inconspicua]|uniref:Beta-carotene isomerase D27-like C-terminal domain-containing protein n=1 Tax=Nitzschia inconspicua TaxID=303405 RepID=A0A9K3KTS9_9STRA|nr:protein of unknown function DUF4033 containing protein [Nitzschia inconspicua]
METRKRKNDLLTLLLMVMVASALVPVGESFLLVRRPDGSKRQIIGVKQTQQILSALQSSSSSTGSFKEATVEWLSRLGRELKQVSDCASIVASAVMLKPDKVKAEDIVTLCDAIDDLENEKGKTQQTDDVLFVSQEPLDLRIRAMKSKRYEYLVKLMQSNYDAYVATASFLSPSRIARRELPNIQDVPVDKNSIPSTTIITAEDGKTPLVADCELEDMKYKDSLLDKILLSIFRNLVTKNTGGVTSDKPGIEGLLEQGRTFMLQPNQTPEAQHEMVYKTLGGLMTPALPPFYRIFMSGIVPKSIDGEGKQLGPWFYAPFLTSFVTPTFFGFLVGPSYPNRRKDGQLGGLVVEKCKFLQESGCKGLCLHQCKLPAQQFFQEELGLPLTVSPNFVTQECQWSFGETPLPPNEDPAFPKGCLVGCESRKAMAASGSKADICN